MKRLNSARGMSLVEATIILMVLAILTAVIAPSMGDYVNDARQTKAKEDVEAIGVSIVRMLKDTGHPFFLVDPSLGVDDIYDMANRVDILVGPGNTPALSATATAYNPGATNGADTSLNWADAVDNDVVDELADHLVTNTITYTSPTLPAPAGSGGPRFGFGWRGSYVSALSSDPWGYRYAVNSIFLGGAADSADRGWANDTVVLSPGANGAVDTRFNLAGLTPGIDDVAYVIQGHTR